MVATVRDIHTQELTYELVPTSALPVVDLSKSLRAQMLPQKVDDAVFDILKRYHKPLMVAAVVGLWLNIVNTLLKASIGQYLSLLSFALGLPMAVGSFSTLRYDIVRLVVRTFDFWSFAIISTLTLVMRMAFVGDLRMPRFVVDWLAFQNLFLIDGQVRGLRYYVITVFIGIVPVLIDLVWVMLGHIDGGRKVPLLTYENQNGYFVLDILDIVGNGSVTLVLLLAKIGYRKRNVLRSDSRGAHIECAILRVGLRFEVLAVKASHDLDVRSGPISSIRVKSTGEMRVASPEVRMTTIQHMQLVKIGHTFTANFVVFPIRSIANRQIPTLCLFFLYVVGATGLLIVCLIPLWEWNSRVDSQNQSLEWASVALICTILFTAPFEALYHRKLLRMLVFSFDFAFYSFQITSANLCIALLYRWNPSHTLVMIAWWLWAHWALTLDALTPVMREKLHLRVCYAAPVIVLLMIGHIYIVCGIFFDSTVNLPDIIVWEGKVWDRRVKVSVFPYYFSRVMTLLLWCSRLAWRLAAASDKDVTLIRGIVCFENCFNKLGRSRTRQLVAAFVQT